MLNQNVIISPLDHVNSILTWYAPQPDYVSWVFLNGIIHGGPIYAETDFRSAIVPLSSFEIKAMEIHDLPENIIPEAITIEPNINPALIWNAVDRALKYKIYYRNSNTKAEQLVYDRLVMPDRIKYQIAPPLKLEGRGGLWHFFRCEAIDKYANESLRHLWTFWAMETPTAPKSLNIEECTEHGFFNFHIETEI